MSVASSRRAFQLPAGDRLCPSGYAEASNAPPVVLEGAAARPAHWGRQRRSLGTAGPAQQGWAYSDAKLRLWTGRAAQVSGFAPPRLGLAIDFTPGCAGLA